MNLILVSDRDLIEPSRVFLSGRRARHICEVHRALVGDELRVGWLNGKIGTGRVIAVTNLNLDFSVELECSFTDDPPSAPSIELLIGLPRPKFLSKVLETATSFGVKKITFINSNRVDKVYWSCNQLTPASLHESILLGLEQAGDTLVPQIQLRPLFKPFVEDEVPRLIEGRRALLAHPRGGVPFPYGSQANTIVAIGPEGGFTDYEINKLVAAGFECVELFPRVLKVETAVAAILGRLI